MYFDKSLSGRNERRLPIMVDVRLAPLERVSAEGHERTFTDNLSAQGLRVHSTRPWHPDEQAEITPVKGETPMHGEVVYCQKVDNDRFFVGFKFPNSRLP
jgi:hypothetical protein